MSTGIERGRQELFAAHLLTGMNLPTQAVASAHRAAVAAAEAAMMALDRLPPAEPAVLTTHFLRLVVRERGLDAAAGRALRAVHNQAVLADTGLPVPAEQAAAAIADATAVVDAVDTWLTSSEFVGIARAALPRAGGSPRRRRR